MKFKSKMNYSVAFKRIFSRGKFPRIEGLFSKSLCESRMNKRQTWRGPMPIQTVFVSTRATQCGFFSKSGTYKAFYVVEMRKN
jgi:hypothetical protein